MQNLYTDQSLAVLNRQLNARLAVLLSGAAVLLGLFIWAMAARIEWLAMAAACLAGCFAVFFADLFCAPLVRYRRLVRTALSGRHHEKALEFCRAEPDSSVVDGVPCRSLIFLGDADKHGDRETMMYWDSELPMPELEPGVSYHVRYTGRNIIGIEAAA